jgi:hypothetical protein
VLLGLFLNAAQAIHKPLERAQDGVQERALALKDTGHVKTKRFGERQQQQKIGRDLSYSQGGHVLSSEPLRPQQRVEEITDQQKRDASRDQVHAALLFATDELQPLTEARKQPEPHQNQRSNQQIG